MIFTVDSYLEYFLTLLGWILNNGIFALFVGTGLWLIPVIALVIKTWRDVAKQGDDEGEKGELLIRWLSIEILMAMLVIVLTLAPMIPVNLNNIEYNVDRSKQCGYRIPLAPQQTGQWNRPSAGKVQECQSGGCSCTKWIKASTMP